MIPGWIQQGLNAVIAGASVTSRKTMGLVAWTKRHYYHYQISVGTYSFYPAEGFMVNAFTLTLFGLTAYYAVRSLWLVTLFLGGLFFPKSA